MAGSSTALPIAFLALLRRDLVLALRLRRELANPLCFFVMVTALFPLGLGPDPAMLTTIAPGLLWVAALLAVLLSQEALFRGDHEDGSLEQLLLSPHPITLLVAAKVSAHWCAVALPLILLAPLLGLLLRLPTEALGPLVISLMLGTPILFLLGAVGAALLVGLRRSGLLLTLLVLPLYVPVLIFGAGAVGQAAAGLSYRGPLYVLAALAVLASTLAPLAAAAALRLGARA